MTKFKIEIDGVDLVLRVDKKKSCVDIISGNIRNALVNISGSVGNIAGNALSVGGDILKGVGGDIGGGVGGVISGDVCAVGGSILNDVDGGIGGSVGLNVEIDVMGYVGGTVHNVKTNEVAHNDNKVPNTDDDDITFVELPQVIDDQVYDVGSIGEFITIDGNDKDEFLAGWKEHLKQENKEDFPKKPTIVHLKENEVITEMEKKLQELKEADLQKRLKQASKAKVKRVTGKELEEIIKNSKAKIRYTVV